MEVSGGEHAEVCTLGTRQPARALLTGVFAQKALNGVADGLLFGNPAQLGIQAIAVGAAIVYSGAMSFLLLKLISLVVPLRASQTDEVSGLDVTLHGEEAYAQSGGRAAEVPALAARESGSPAYVNSPMPIS